uniref:Secreted protein n=1 Tax=Angiostrongylus cantonensis TaxID=6313 RepID=A0A0K0CVR1_ANGCA
MVRGRLRALLGCTAYVRPLLASSGCGAVAIMICIEQMIVVEGDGHLESSAVRRLLSTTSVGVVTLKRM